MSTTSLPGRQPLPRLHQRFRLPPFRHWARIARERRLLATLDARQLCDIGLTRAEAAREAARPFWDTRRR